MADGPYKKVIGSVVLASVPSGAPEARVVFTDTPEGPWTEATPWTDVTATASAIETPTRWTRYTLKTRR